MKLRCEHRLCRSKLRNRPSPIIPTPIPRPRRDRRQQARQTAKPTAELAGTDRRRIACMLAGVAQTSTAPTRERLVGLHVKMLDPPPAPAHKKLLPVAAKVARLPHHVEHLRFVVDDDADRRLAREGAVQGGGSEPRARRSFRAQVLDPRSIIS